MDNETIFAHKEKIAITENSIATVAAVITDNWSQEKWNDEIIKFFENSTSNSINDINATPTTTFTNSTIQNYFNIISGWNIFEEIPWLIWIITTATLLVIIILIIILTYLVLSKKRNNGSDQRFSDSFDNISQFMWPRWMSCCPKSIFDRQEDLRMMRQNSASNLDPYRRPPLSPVNHKDLCEDEYHSNFLLSQRLESLKTEYSYLNALTRKAENMSMLIDAHDRNGNNLFGINMTGIREIPVMSIQNGRRRPLPVSSPSCFNHL
ncbi:Protein orai [Dirofilaria immitis]